MTQFSALSSVAGILLKDVAQKAILLKHMVEKACF
jgi:hypothetical protein